MKSKALRALALSLLSFLAIPNSAFAQRLFEWIGTTFASDAEGGDRFGSSVAVEGDTLVVGARNDDDLAPQAGSAYVYRWIDGQWQEEQKLFIDGTAATAQFGASVTIDGDVIVVGAPGDDSAGVDVGSATVFRYNGTAWVREAKLLPPAGATFTSFGEAVAVYEDAVLVGAPTFGTSPVTGAAFVFRYAGGAWLQEQQLNASDGAAGDRFGAAVALRRADILIGSPRNDEVGTDAGAAYLFQRQAGSWVQGTKLRGETQGDQFGFAVVLDGRVAAIGAPYYDYYNAGRVYVYRGGRFTMLEQELQGYQGASLHFGSALALDGDTLLVAPGTFRTLAFFAYDGNQWFEQESGRADLGPYEAVALHGSRAVAAAPEDDARGPDAGAFVALTGVADGCFVAEAHDKISPQDGTALSYDVSISSRSEITAVGSPGEGVLILEKRAGRWIHTETIPPTLPQVGFGAAVALGDGDLIVGTPGDDAQGLAAGAAEAYQWNGATWQRTQTLRASDGRSFSSFGGALAMDGDRLVIGAWQHDRRGAAYVFRKISGQWIEEAKLDAAAPNSDEGFGDAVALSGNLVIVGADNDSAVGYHAGAAYVFRLLAGTWTLEQKLQSSDLAAYHYFGTSVAIAGDMAVVSAPYTSPNPYDGRGTVYTFRWNGASWVEESTLHPADRLDFPLFGLQLALRPEGLAVVSDSDAYFFRRITSSTWLQVAHYVPSNRLEFRWHTALGWNGREAFAVEQETWSSSKILVFQELLSLGITPGTAKQGDRLDFVVANGQPAAPVVLAIVGIDDLPLFLVVAQGRFDVNGRYTLHVTVPPGVPEARIVFKAGGYSSDGSVRLSEAWNVWIE